MSANKTRNFRRLLSAMFVALLISIAVIGQSSGGQFTIEQVVIANGGGTSAGGVFTVAGTNGQPVAGTHSTSTQFTLHGGFWQEETASSPTAALVSVSGRVTTAAGQGIQNVRLTLFQSDGTSQTALTAGFGYYTFDGIQAGQTVIVTASAKNFTFAQPAQVLFVGDNLMAVDFVANN